MQISEKSNIYIRYGDVNMKPVSTDNAFATQLDLLPSFFKNEGLYKSIFASNFPKIAVIGTGQVGGIMASNLAALGFPTFIVNTANKDMYELEKHDFIPKENFIFLSTYQNNEVNNSLQGTAKDIEKGKEITRDNLGRLKNKLFLREELVHADHIVICSSLSGGSGSGSLKLLIKAISQFKLGSSDTLTPIHLIGTLPSKSERGVNVRANAKDAMATVQAYMYDPEFTRLGGVYLVDNEYVENNDYLSDYVKSNYPNLTPLQVSNTTAMLNIFMAFSIQSLYSEEGGNSIDNAEIQSVLNQGGFLNILHRFNDTEMVSDYKNAVQDSSTDATIITSYVKQYVKDFLNEKNAYSVQGEYKSDASNVIIQFILPLKFDLSIVSAIQKEFKLLYKDIHFGVSHFAHAEGLSMILVKNRYAAPERYEEILHELKLEILEHEKAIEKNYSRIEKLADLNDDIQSYNKNDRTSTRTVSFDFDDLDEETSSSNAPKKPAFGRRLFGNKNTQADPSNLSDDEF